MTIVEAGSPNRAPTQWICVAPGCGCLNVHAEECICVHEPNTRRCRHCHTVMAVIDTSTGEYVHFDSERVRRRRARRRGPLWTVRFRQKKGSAF